MTTRTFTCISLRKKQSVNFTQRTIPVRRNLTGNTFANGNGTDTERVRKRERNGYRTDTEWILNRNGMDTEWLRITKMEKSILQNYKL